MSTSSVALVHDYLTQRGGAERVVLSMARALDTRCVYTSLFDPQGTFPEFADLEVRSSWLDRVPSLSKHHRAAFPLLALVFSRLEVNSEITVCSSSGWAHGVRTSGRKIVYCHAPARWLYQTDRYLGTRMETEGLNMGDRLRLGLKRGALSLARGQLEKWDKKAALSADRYLVNSTAVAASVEELYGIKPEVLPPPPALGPDGPIQPIEGVEPGFWLCVSRLLRYKHVDAIVKAMRSRPSDRLVIVGSGPDRDYLESLGAGRVTFVGGATDAQLRWCYANCRALVTASFEDFGLTPLEAASFGKPSGALRFGGFLDTIVEGVTGAFIVSPNAQAVGDTMDELSTTSFSADTLTAHAHRFSEEQFGRRLRAVVFEDSKTACPPQPTSGPLTELAAPTTRLKD